MQKKKTSLSYAKKNITHFVAVKIVFKNTGN